MSDSATSQDTVPAGRTLIAAAVTGKPATDDDPAAAKPVSRTLIAAATTGVPAAGDAPPAAEPPSRREHEFRLHTDETVAEGIRRAVRGQLAQSSAALAGVNDRDELGEAVHSTRKSIKRVRATLRLSRDAIDAQVYERENTTMRAIAGRLAGARDAQVLIETLRALEERPEDGLSPQTTERLYARLRDDHTREIEALANEGDLAVTTGQALEDARVRTAQWAIDQDGFAAVEPGLRRVYRRGRNRLRATCGEPSAEGLHDVRKRVKDLWHAAELLREAHPKRMKRLARDAHRLSDLLGDHHDLSVLRDFADGNPQLFSDMNARAALLSEIDRRRDELRDRALEVGRRLYKRPPKRFVREVARGWEKRVSLAD